VVIWFLFELELDWEKASQRRKEEQLQNRDRTLDRAHSLQRPVDQCMVELTHEQDLGIVRCVFVSASGRHQGSQYMTGLHRASDHKHRTRQITV
jgi:hypothetical protein